MSEHDEQALTDALERELHDYVDLAEDGWARQAARACVETVRLCGWTPPSAARGVIPAEEEPEVSP